MTIRDTEILADLNPKLQKYLKTLKRDVSPSEEAGEPNGS